MKDDLVKYSLSGTKTTTGDVTVIIERLNSSHSVQDSSSFVDSASLVYVFSAAASC